MRFEIYSRVGRVEQIPEETSVTVGVFDGVHRGHQQLLSQMDGARLVVTLTAHPSFVLGRRESEYWLDDPEEHLSLLFEAGAKYVAVLPFTQEVARMTACETTRMLYSQLKMRNLLVGYDSRFGNKADDDFGRLPDLAAELGFTLQRGMPSDRRCRKDAWRTPPCCWGATTASTATCSTGAAWDTRWASLQPT